MDFIGLRIKNRYRISELIKEGMVSRIFTAYDEFSKDKVAIKIFKNDVILSKNENTIRFKLLINEISKIDHKNIVKIFSCGEILNYNYIAEKYVESYSLSDYNEKFDLKRILSIIYGIAEGLQAAHNNKIIHRDLKPSNILVAPDSILISDFCVAGIKDYYTLAEKYSVSDNNKILQMFGYMPPEFSGIIKGSFDERGDLYSLGIIFYELLTGKLPFTSDSFYSLIREQISRVPEPPSKFINEIPPIIDRIVQKMIDKFPNSRYQSAAGLLADINKVLNGNYDFEPGSDDISYFPTYKTSLIGREKELALIKNAVEKSGKSEINYCVIQGNSGTGKSRLIDEVEHIVRINEMVMIKAACDTTVGKSPYWIVSMLLNSYMKIFNQFSDEKKDFIRRSLNSELSSNGELLLKLSKDISQLIDVKLTKDDLPVDVEKKRLHFSVNRLFKNLLSSEKSMIVVIEDIQWVDYSSLELLSVLMFNSDLKNILFIISIRTDEDIADEKIRNFISDLFIQKNLFKIKLNNLTVDNVRSIITEVFSNKIADVNKLAEFVFAKSGGNPLFAILIIRQLVDSDVVINENNNWLLENSLLKEIQIFPSIIDSIKKNIKLLSSQEMEFLTYSSFVGKEFDIEIISKLCGIPFDDAINIIDNALSLQIIIPSANTGKYSFFHSRIMESFNCNITDTEIRRKIHQTIALELEKKLHSGEDVLYEAAYHYIEAGDDEKIIEFALPSAVKSKNNYAFDEAERYFLIVLAIYKRKGDVNDKIIEINKMLGEIYVFKSRYEEALNCFNTILPQINNDYQLASIYEQIGNVYYRKGDWENCEKNLIIALKYLKENISRNKIIISVSIIEQIFLHVLYKFFENLITPKIEIDSPKYKLMILIYEALGRMYILYSPVKLLSITIRALHISQRKIGPSKEYARCMTTFGGLLSATTMFSMAKQYLDKTYALTKKINYSWGEGWCASVYGYFYEWTADYTKGLEIFEKSLEIFDRIGDVKETSMALNGMEHCHYYKADYIKAKKINNRYYNLVMNADDDYCISAAEIYYSQIARETGDIEKAQFYADKSNRRSKDKKIWFNYCSSLIEMGSNELLLDNHNKALEHFIEAMKLFESENFLVQYIAHIYSLAATAAIRKFEKERSSMPESEADELLKSIEIYSKKGLRKTKKWLTHYGTSLRAYARFMQIKGATEKAEIFYKKSIDVCLKTERKYELALTYYDYAMFVSQNGEKSNGGEYLLIAYQLFNEIGSELYVQKINNIFGITLNDDSKKTISGLIEKECTDLLGNIDRNIGNIGNSSVCENMLNSLLNITGSLIGIIFIEDKNSKLIIKQSVTAGNAPLDYPESLINYCFIADQKIIINYGSENNYSGMSEESEKFKSIMCLPYNSGKKGILFLGNKDSYGVFSYKAMDIIEHILEKIFYTANEKTQDIESEIKKKEEYAISPALVAKLEKVRDYIDSNYLEDLSREGLAGYVNMNYDYLGKVFKQWSGLKISEYVNKKRVDDSADRLLNSSDNIIDIAYSVGFESVTTFNRAFSKFMRTTPQNYRVNKKG